MRISVPQRAFQVLDKTRQHLTLTKLALDIAQKAINAESLTQLLSEILPAMGDAMDALAIYARVAENNRVVWYIADDAPTDIPNQLIENHGNRYTTGNVLRLMIPVGTQMAAMVFIATRYPWTDSPENEEILKSLITSLTQVGERDHHHQRLQQKTKTILDIETVLNMSSIVLILDHRAYITYANNKFCELSQYPRDELIGKHIRHIQNKLLKPMIGCLRRGQIWRGDIQNLKKDQSDYWLNVTIMPFWDDQEKPYQYVAIGQDITEQKQTWQALKESERRKELFVATLTHDLKTPIQSELKILEHLGHGHLGPLNDSQLDVVSELSRSNRYLYHMVNNVLSTYRFEEGKIKLHKECVDLHDMIHQVLTGYVRTLAKEKNITFEDNLAPGTCVILVDQIELKRVIYNLIQNAIHHSPGAEKIIVSTTIIQRPGQYHSDVELSITDRGPGIAIQQQQNLFQPYSVVKTFRPVGTGLGLYLSKQIIEAHRGKIGVESIPGQGSRFYFQLRMVNTAHLIQSANTPTHFSQKIEDLSAIESHTPTDNNHINALNSALHPESGCLKFMNS